MLGQPKYQYGEKVQFQFDQKTVVGEVYIIDAYGTFFQNEEPAVLVFPTTTGCFSLFLFPNSGTSHSTLSIPFFDFLRK